MKRWLREWKSLGDEYSVGMILDAAFGGFLLATLVFAPVFLALAELIVVFMQWKMWLFLLLTGAAMGYFHLISRWWFQSLALKRPEHRSDLRYLQRVHGLLGVGFAGIGGLLFTFVLLPIIWI
jgi:hypothetical protein